MQHNIVEVSVLCSTATVSFFFLRYGVFSTPTRLPFLYAFLEGGLPPLPHASGADARGYMIEEG